MVVVAMLAMAVIPLLVILFVWWVGRSSKKAQVPPKYTKAHQNERLTQHFGSCGVQLYSAIGDALGQKSGWQKSMDIVFEVLDNNPHLMLEYLIECYGIEEVLNALGEYEGEAERFSIGTRLKGY